MTRALSGRAVCALLIGLLPLLPHLARMASLHSVSDYTPFSVTSPSAVTWDEAFLYGSEANYMMRHHEMANDTDTFEHRTEPFPYSVLSVGAEVAIATLSGGLERAQIICSFIFPAITAWILIGMFVRSEINTPLSAVLALIVIAFGFGSAIVIQNDIALLRHGLHGTAVNSIAASRNPNPNMSFSLYLGAIVCLCAGLRRKSLPLLAMAGVLGGLLFYTYIYYAIGWCAAILILTAIALLRPLLVTSKVAMSLAVSFVTSLPFFWWKHLSHISGAYQHRANRLGTVYGYLPSGKVALQSLTWIVVAAALWICWRKLRAGMDDSNASSELAVLVLVLISCVIGGIAGMNMQLVTGFNVQADLHFQHMILHPVSLLVACLIAGAALRRTRLGWTPFAVLFVLCAAAQIEAGVASAPFHRMSASDRALFDWLNQNTPAHAVIATSDLRLCAVLPVYTHNATLLANGSRTTATNEELIERYLLASKMNRIPTQVVQAQLSQELGADSPLPFATYSYFLFETSPYIVPKRRRFTPSAVPPVIDKYRELNLAAELDRLRVEYVWMKDGPPAEVPGWSSSETFRTDSGSLWMMHRLQ